MLVHTKPKRVFISSTVTGSALGPVVHVAVLLTLSGGAAEAGRGRGCHALICRHCSGRDQLTDTGSRVQWSGDEHRV